MHQVCTHTQSQGSRPGQSDESLSHALLDKFVDAGGNFIDTADVYQFGFSETIIGMATSYYRRHKFCLHYIQNTVIVVWLYMTAYKQGFNFYVDKVTKFLVVRLINEL